MVKKQLLAGIFLAGFSLLLCLSFIEILLRTGLLDNSENPKPIWIPRKYKAIEDSIHKKKLEIAAHYPLKCLLQNSQFNEVGVISWAGNNWHIKTELYFLRNYTYVIWVKFTDFFALEVYRYLTREWIPEHLSEPGSV